MPILYSVLSYTIKEIYFCAESEKDITKIYQIEFRKIKMMSNAVNPSIQDITREVFYGFSYEKK